MTALPRKTTGAAKALQREIAGELKDMPIESLIALREFAAFLRQRTGKTIAPVANSATVEMPADSLQRLAGILPPVGGDALADTEGLYDQV